MNDIIAKITLYQNLFRICLALSILFLVIAITIFWVLDIRTTIGYLTGRRAKKEIKELEEANGVSGRLMTKSKSMQYVAQEMKNDMGVRQPAEPGMRKVEHAVEPAAKTNVPQLQTTEELRADSSSESEQTQLMGEQYTECLNGNETEVLIEQGTVLLGSTKNHTERLSANKSGIGKFLIVREVIMIHTEEVI